MKKKLVLLNTIIVAIALILMFGLGIVVTRENNYRQAEEKIVQLTKVYAKGYSATANYNEKIDKNIRVTIVDATGKVLADSDKADVSTIENHIDREEIISALGNKPKVATRFSETLGKDMLYYAEKVQTEDSYVFVRVAIAVDSVNVFVANTIIVMVLIFIVAMIISVIASIFLGNGLIKPLKNVKKSLQSVADGTYTAIMPTTDDSDVNEIISDINDVNNMLKNTISSAQEDKRKLDYIINNVSDCIVVFDSQGNVELINKNASDVFGVDNANGKTAKSLVADKRLADSIAECFVGKDSSIFETTINEKVFLCAVKYTDSGLVIVVLSNITETKNKEKMRSEFFANASHELKTPLTSIKGFNELISLKNKDKDIETYSEKITRESTRMLSLIDDMLNLSKLENSTKPNKTEVDIKAVADEVADSLSTIAKDKNIAINIFGNGKVFAEKEHIFELIKNLVENSLRYNEKGGKVDISVKTAGKKTLLVVADNGIGIDDEHQSRIFERFYRVDKSRSRETGGTGLGLSIVKHIAELYHADLKLSSKIGVGTSVFVSFSNTHN